MKLAVYEMSEAEIPYFEEFAKQYQLELVTTSKTLNRESVSMAEGCQGITILGRSRVNAQLIQCMKALGISCLSARTIGLDHIDMQAAKKYDLSVTNALYGPDGVAEFTVMLMLMVLRRYKPALWRQQVNDYSLGGLLGGELKHQTVGVIGTGRIGASVIQILSGFGCKILAYDPVQNESVCTHATYVEVSELYRRSDIISLHMPLTQDTQYMINRDSLATMKEDVILINTARGELVDSNALIERLEQKKIGGLGLDVLAEERELYHYDKKTEILSNREMSYLRQFPNVVLTQHMAFYTDTNIRDMVHLGIKGLVDHCNQQHKVL